MTETPKRSTFVTVVAWIFIALSGLGVFSSALMAVMVQFVFPDGVDHLIQSLLEVLRDPPPAIVFVLNHIRLLLLLSVFSSAFNLVSSIGLLKRWNWARWCFIGFMLLSIAWSLISPVINFYASQYMYQHMPQILQQLLDLPPEAMEKAMSEMDVKASVIQSVVTSIASAIGFSVLYGWIIKRLLSAPIVAEFRRSSASRQEQAAQQKA